MNKLIAALREWIEDERPGHGRYVPTAEDMARYDTRNDLLDDLGHFLDKWEAK